MKNRQISPCCRAAVERALRRIEYYCKKDLSDHSKGWSLAMALIRGECELIRASMATRKSCRECKHLTVIVDSVYGYKATRTPKCVKGRTATRVCGLFAHREVSK